MKRKLIALFLLSGLACFGQSVERPGAEPLVSSPSSGDTIMLDNTGPFGTTRSLSAFYYVPAATTVNGHALTGNVTVTPGDLGLVIGTNTEAWSAQLDTMAANGSAFYLNSSNQNAGTLAAARLPAFTGDVTSPAGSSVNTLATVNSNVGTYGSATQSLTATVNAKGLVIAISAQTVTPAWGSITGTPTTLSGYGITDGVNAGANDTNVTQSISGHTLTLGWTGTLAAGRLNSNVVQSVVNDTNVTGAISGQALTLGWTGTLANARLAHSTIVVNGTTLTLGDASDTVTAAAGTLTGSTLASGVTASSLTGVGTITSGTWQGAAISGAYLAGPHAFTSMTANNIVTGNGSSPLQASGATITSSGNVFTLAGGSTDTDSSGTRTIAGGSSGASLVLGSGANASATLTPTGTGSVSVNGTTSSNVASLGSELTSSSGWTSTGWTGSYAAGFTNGSGNTSPLSYPVSLSAGSVYQITFAVTGGGSGYTTLSLGGSTVTTINPSTLTWTCNVTAINTGALIFTPPSTFTGTIGSISVKQITPATAALSIYDSTSVQRNAFSAASTNGLGIGIGANAYSVSNSNDSGNVIIGNSAAIGWGASGFTGNVIIGQSAVGSGSSFRASNGGGGQQSCVIIGYQAALYATGGVYNNVIIGYQAGLNAQSPGATITGYQSGYNWTTGGGSGTISLYGYAAGYSATTPNSLDAFGANSCYYNTTGNDNVGIGKGSLFNNQTGSYNTAVGMQAGYGSASNSFSNNSLFGYLAGYALTTGGNNVLLGYYAGSNLTSGGTNIIIGYNLSAASATGSNQLNIGGWITGASGVITIPNTTASTSTTTGSFVNDGGFGNAGAAYIGGGLNVTAGGATIVGTDATNQLSVNSASGGSGGTHGGVVISSTYINNGSYIGINGSFAPNIGLYAGNSDAGVVITRTSSAATNLTSNASGTGVMTGFSLTVSNGTYTPGNSGCTPLVVNGNTYTNSSATGASGTPYTSSTFYYTQYLGTATLNSTSGGSTYNTTTNAATLYIAGAPVAGTMAITNAYALYVAGGASYFGGAVTSAGGFGCNGASAQGKYASGGTLAGVVAALVADGILSN